MREGGILSLSRALSSPLPSPKFLSEQVHFSDQAFYDSNAGKRRRETALRERGLLSPVSVSRILSAPVSFNPSHRVEEYPEKYLLPPHDNHGRKREAPTLEDGIQNVGKQSEHIKTGQRKRRQQTLPPQRHGAPHDVQTQSAQPFSSLEVDMTPLPIPCYRQSNSSTPASPSDDLGGFSFPVQAVSPRCSKPDTNPSPVLPRSSSSPEELSGELLHERQPLALEVFTPKRMAAKLQKIGDDDSRRLTRLAFMM